MAGERFAQLAVTQLVAYMAAQLPAQLRAVETERGMAINTLADPTRYVGGHVPKDNQAPLLQAWEESWEYVQTARIALVKVMCKIAISIVGDADVETGQSLLRDYETAILKVLAIKPMSLGNTVTAAFPRGGEADVSLGDHSQTRHIFAQVVEIHVQDQ